jgi:hypothetical protein
MAGSPVGELRPRELENSLRHGDVAGAGNIEAADKVEERGLPEPLRPHEGHEVPLALDVEVDPRSTEPVTAPVVLARRRTRWTFESPLAPT